jgi:hypothetical protein
LSSDFLDDLVVRVGQAGQRQLRLRSRNAARTPDRLDGQGPAPEGAAHDERHLDVGRVPIAYFSGTDAEIARARDVESWDDSGVALVVDPARGALRQVTDWSDFLAPRKGGEGRVRNPERGSSPPAVAPFGISWWRRR